MRIDSYQFGEIVIEGKRYHSDVILYPDRVKSDWWRKEGHELCLEDLQEVLSEKPRKIIVGTGAANCLRVLPETEKRLRAEAIELTVLPTPKAVETYNQLPASGRKDLIACLHLTC